MRQNAAELRGISGAQSVAICTATTLNPVGHPLQLSPCEGRPLFLLLLLLLLLLLELVWLLLKELAFFRVAGPRLKMGREEELDRSQEKRKEGHTSEVRGCPMLAFLKQMQIQTRSFTVHTLCTRCTPKDTPDISHPTGSQYSDVINPHLVFHARRGLIPGWASDCVLSSLSSW